MNSQHPQYVIKATDDQVTWWRVCHTMYSWEDGAHQPSPSYMNTSTIRWTLEKSLGPEGEYSRFIDDWREVAMWTFRITEVLTDCQVQCPASVPFTIKSWGDVQKLVQATAQDTLARQLVDGKKFSDESVKATAWVLKEATPFHIWCVYQRVRDAVDEVVSTDLIGWTAGDAADVTSTVDKAWSDLSRILVSTLTPLRSEL